MKKSYKCERLETTLHFLPNQIKFCCSCAEGPSIEIKDYKTLDKNSLTAAKTKYIKELASGRIPKQCIGCVDYKEIKQSPADIIKNIFKKPAVRKIEHIIADHYKQCDCSCIYCSQKIIHKDSNTQYELLPIIKDLYNQDMIDKDKLRMEFQGGNVSMLKEFDDIVEECLKNGCERFEILMNGIKYLPVIEKIKSEKSFVCISLDCGTRETFAKIKNVDAFDETISNIRRIKENTILAITLKYIIIQGVNDNIDEIKAFIDIAKDLVRNGTVVFDLDYRDIMIDRSNNFKVPEHYYNITEFAEKYCKENDLTYNMPDFAKSVLAKGNNQI